MAVKPIPEGYHTVTPYLVVEDVAQLLDFVTRAFGATVGDAHSGPDGRITHAEFTIGDSHVMVGGARKPEDCTRAMLYLYVPDVDARYRKAIEAGATSVREVADQFYGDRSGGVSDRFGNQWWMATRIEDVPSDELARRAATAHHG